MNAGDEIGCAQADPRPQWQQKLEAARKEARWQAYLFYCRWFYRAHMRWLHKRGRHQWKRFGMPEPDSPTVSFHKCEWCGAMKYPNGAAIYPAPYSGPQTGRE